jgi:hypothetical protein
MEVRGCSQCRRGGSKRSRGGWSQIYITLMSSLEDPATYPHQREKKVDPNLDEPATLEIGIQPHWGIGGKDLYNNSVLRIRIRDPVPFDSWIRDPVWVKKQNREPS